MTKTDKNTCLNAYQTGKTPLLSLAELLSFFPDKNFVDISENNIIIQHPVIPNPQKFLNQLGGSLKISEIFQILPLTSSPSDLIFNINLFIAENCNQADKKINFAVNVFQPKKDDLLLRKLLTNIKINLKKNNISNRFVNKNFQNIPSSTSYQEHLTNENNFEINVIFGKEKIYLGKTAAIQNIDNYSFRDYEKPFRDTHSGMIPPKLAQIMINLALPLKANSYKLKAIYDPFCGTGTILTEALLMGYNVIGSDISEKAVESTRKNIEWLNQEFHIDPQLTAEIFVHDAKEPFPGSIDEHPCSPLPPIPYNLRPIITEPYLGTPLTREPSPEQITQIQSELKSLYLKFFRNLKNIIPAKTPIIIIFSYIKAHNKRNFLQINSEIEKLGYKTETFIPKSLQKKFNLGLNKFPSLLYERKDQLVGREIWKFIKT